MPRLTNPRAQPISINLPDNIFIGYDVRLDTKDNAGNLVDIVTAHWLIPEANGSFRKRTIDVASPAALAANQAIFNSTKDLVS